MRYPEGMRLLDLGCGKGVLTDHLLAKPDDSITGIDVDHESLVAAKRRFPEREFIQARGEQLPIASGSFDRVFCNLSLPYMHIPTAMREIRRVLKSDGDALLAIHHPSFTLQELKNSRNLKAILFRVYVLLSGLCFHVTGYHLPKESFQTERGMRIALRRAGFSECVLFPLRKRIMVHARLVESSATGIPLDGYSSTTAGRELN
ncbi:MAG: class I SAM-dependent methyltransferase [Acidobacteriota bacterium]|nr:class I SAM-dependent methyltransferase [Acidobacteriota bacterium]